MTTGKDLPIALVSILVALLVGVWEMGRLIQVQQVLSNAAREGAREAASSDLTVAQVKQVVIAYIQSAGLPTSNVQVTVVNVTHATPAGVLVITPTASSR